MESKGVDKKGIKINWREGTVSMSSPRKELARVSRDGQIEAAEGESPLKVAAEKEIQEWIQKRDRKEE